MMMKYEKKLYNAAKVSLSPELYEDFVRAVNDTDIDSLILFVGSNYKEKAESALKSIYNGDCDLVVFDQYKKGSDLYDALENFMLANPKFVVADVQGS